MLKEKNAKKLTTKEVTMRKIVRVPEMSLIEEKAIIEFYEALAPMEKTGEINIQNLTEVAFPAFEKTIGENAFQKVKKYFGIGCIKAKRVSVTKASEVKLLLAKLRTIENAKLYLTGYRQLLEEIASKMYGAPEEMSYMEKAKLIRMFFTIFVGNYFFLDEFVSKKERAISAEKVAENSDKIFYPESLFSLYELAIKDLPKNDLMYDAIINELKMIGTNERKEVLAFAELKASVSKDGEMNFISINKASSKVSLKDVREIKKNVFKIPALVAVEKFASKSKVEETVFQSLYEVYKAVTEKDYTTYKKVSIKRATAYDKTILSFPVKGYMIFPEYIIASEQEVQRIVFTLENAAKKGFLMNVKILNEKNGKTSLMRFPIGIHVGAIKFAKDMGYLPKVGSMEDELNFANILVEIGEAEKASHDKEFIDYLNGKYSKEEFKEILGIDKKFEIEKLGFIQKETPIEAAFRFASNFEKEINQELIENILLKENEDVFKQYAEGKIKDDLLKKKIGFEEEFAAMYFNSKGIDISRIEKKLMTLKRSFAGTQGSSLVIKLYCYVIENQIPCGPKMKVPKRRKELKPSNLRNLI